MNIFPNMWLRKQANRNFFFGSICVAIIMVLLIAYRYIDSYRNQIDLQELYFQDFLNSGLRVDINITPRNPKLENYYRKLCDLDKKRLERIKNIDFRTQTIRNVQHLFHEFVMDPHNAACINKQRFGGKYIPSCRYTDGAKFVCMDQILNDIENNQCLVYSFGIANDWTFEDIMDDIGCTVYAFDPTVDFPRKRGTRISFQKLGVSAYPDEANSIDTLSSILYKNGHMEKKISYLKMDIEGHELTGLQRWFDTGALNNVQQIALEFHVDSISSALKFFETLRILYFKGSYRLFSYDVNGCVANLANFWQFLGNFGSHYNLAEIVLTKVGHTNVCTENISMRQKTEQNLV